MKLQDIAERLDLRCLTLELAQELQSEVTCGHASDLLSDVLANASAGGVVVTLQAHMNTIAVAVNASLRAVVLSSGRTPDPDVLAKAVEEGIVIYVSEEPTFDVVGKLYALGLRGTSL